MANRFGRFEGIVRRAHRYTEAPDRGNTNEHPFDAVNIHSDLPASVRDLFDDGHYAQATFEALKFVDEEVQRVSGLSDFGKSLMMRAFGGENPALSVNEGATLSDKSEQEGFKFLFAGAMQGIRNPRGHSTLISDDPDTCLAHLSLASLLLRRIDEAGLR